MLESVVWLNHTPSPIYLGLPLLRPSLMDGSRLKASLPDQVVIWHCQCQCGRELDVSYNALVHGMIVSCGCRKEAFSHQLPEMLTHVANTSVELLRSKKMRKDNTTGVTGVYLVQGYYRAEIGFQGKHYLLGSYKKLETAAAVRKVAEKVLHEQF